MYNRGADAFQMSKIVLTLILHVGASLSFTIATLRHPNPKNKIDKNDGLLYVSEDCEDCKNKKFGRSTHCENCNVCINKRDHHCIWINQCVGRRNMFWFIAFLNFTSTGSLLMAI